MAASAPSIAAEQVAAGAGRPPVGEGEAAGGGAAVPTTLGIIGCGQVVSPVAREIAMRGRGGDAMGGGGIDRWNQLSRTTCVT